jgi:hypothetical protein
VGDSGPYLDPVLPFEITCLESCGTQVEGTELRLQENLFDLKILYVSTDITFQL